MNKVTILAILVLTLLVYYFSGVGLEFSNAEKIIVALVAGVMFFLSARKDLHQFFVVVLASFTTAMSVGCAFLSQAQATGPFQVDVTLHPWIVVIITVVVTLIAWAWQAKGKSDKRFGAIMLTLFVFNWVMLAFNVKFYDDWKMENWLTVPFVVIIYITHKWFRLSNVSYGLIYAYMMLHIYGSHYTYAEVPFGFWMQNVLDMSRNHYDRIVHFSFGFLLAYPLREMTVRISDTKGFWSYWFPVEFVLAFSCIYELLEWWIAVVFGGDLGVAYLGTQGDVWDAQKDMALAGGGAVIAMLVVAVIIWYYKRGEFFKEIRQSLRVKSNVALGEVALREMQK